MKRILILLFVGLLVLSCNNTNNQSEEQESVKWEMTVSSTNNRLIKIEPVVDAELGEEQQVALYLEDTENKIFLTTINYVKSELDDMGILNTTDVEIILLDSGSKQVDKYKVTGDLPANNNDIIIADEKSKDYILNNKGYVIFSLTTMTGTEEIKVPTYANNKETEKDK